MYVTTYVRRYEQEDLHHPLVIFSLLSFSLLSSSHSLSLFPTLSQSLSPHLSLHSSPPPPPSLSLSFSLSLLLSFLPPPSFLFTCPSRTGRISMSPPMVCAPQYAAGTKIEPVPTKGSKTRWCFRMPVRFAMMHDSSLFIAVVPTHLRPLNVNAFNGTCGYTKTKKIYIYLKKKKEEKRKEDEVKRLEIRYI